MGAIKRLLANMMRPHQFDFTGLDENSCLKSGFACIQGPTLIEGSTTSNQAAEAKKIVKSF